MLVVHSASATAVFRCQFSNWDGSDDKTFSVIVTGISGGIVAVIVIVSIIILIFIVLIGVFLKSTYKQKVKYVLVSLSVCQLSFQFLTIVCSKCIKN